VIDRERGRGEMGEGVRDVRKGMTHPLPLSDLLDEEQ
jgi:hypothetical protein